MANARRKEHEVQLLKRLREKEAANKERVQRPASEEQEEEGAGGEGLSLEQTLAQAAAKELRKVSADLSKSLSDKAAKGDVASARLLLHLMERGNKAMEGEGRAENHAETMALLERWTTEPEWEGPKYGEEFLRLCNEQGVRDAQKACAYGIGLLGSDAIDGFRDAGRDRADAGFKEVAGLVGEGSVEAS